MKNIKELREKRQSLFADLEEMRSKAKIEKRDLLTEEWDKFHLIDKDIEDLSKKILLLEKQEARDAEFQAIDDETAKEKDLSVEELQVKTNGAFLKMIKGGMNALSPDEQKLVKPSNERALSTTTTAGGYTIPDLLAKKIEKAMLEFGGMLKVSTILNTAGGEDLSFPTNNDTGNKGAILSENTQVSEQDTVFDILTLGAYMYTSKLVRVSIQLLQDSAFNIGNYLAEILGERLARILSDHFTTGTGSSQPNGVITGATDSGITPTASAVTRDDIVDLIHSVGISYRKKGILMFSDATMNAIRKLDFGTADSRPLYQASAIAGQPDLIEGKQFVINDSMDDIGASNKFMAFGDFKKYLIRNSGGKSMVIFHEKYMDYLQKGFLAFSRHDGDLLDAGTHPVKYLVNAAT